MMQCEFADRLGQCWRVEVDQLRTTEIDRASTFSEPGTLRPGLSFVLCGKSGVQRWSIWVPFRSMKEAAEASEDLDYLDRVVEEMYYTALAGR